MKKIVLLFLIIVATVIFLTGETYQTITPKEKAIIKTSGRYLFMDEKTPDYIIRKAISKGIDPAFILKGSSGEWFRNKLEMIKTTSPLIFVKGKLTPLEKKYFDEIIKFTDFRAQIICFSKECTSNESWDHPLIKRKYTILRDKDENIVMEGLKMKSLAMKNSVLDNKSFIDSPVVKSGLYFKNLSYAFISLDSKVEISFFKDASKVVYYSDSEKKMSDFVEK
jgi:hypothetical protein